MTNLKEAVRQHWEAEPCESRTGVSSDRRKFFAEIDEYRYSKSPFIERFAKFEEANGKRVLEVGLGSGSDFIRWARAGATAFGRDLTQAAVNICTERLQMEGLSGNVAVGDVEALDLPEEYFDLVYSYGVIHHTPNTAEAVRQLYRVLKPGGTIRVMIYNLTGLSAFYQWCLFGLLRGRWTLSRRDVMATYNESPGTKLYSHSEAAKLFECFKDVKIESVIDSGDTLQFQLSDRYKHNLIIRAAFLVAPLLKPFLGKPSRYGTTMLIEARK
jgi:ubiquinone/menaquinone biosynthesis C-methylase UbiE